MDRDVRRGDRLGTEDRREQREAVVLALVPARRFGVLEGLEDRAQAGDVLAKPRAGGADPGYAIAPFAVALDLRTEPECEAAVRKALQVPRHLRNDHRRARKGDRDPGLETNALRVLGRDQEREEGVVPCRLGGKDRVEAEGLDALRACSEAGEAELGGLTREAVALDERNSDTHRIVWYADCRAPARWAGDVVFEHLLSPGRIGPVALRNRIVMSAMGTNLAEEDGCAGERIQRYYEERARGGVGLVIVGVAAVAHPAGTCIPRQIGISDERFVPGLAALASRVHAHGAKAAIQLQHAGKVATQDIASGRPLWVPSIAPGKLGDLMNDLAPDEAAAITAPFSRPGAKVAFHEMTFEDVATLADWFAAAADRARRARFDAIEIHGAHGYLLSSFLSPASNTRSDAYGGGLEGRSRALCEVIRAVKARVGGDLAVWVRLDAKEFRVENGITPEDAQRTAELAEAAGADAIHVTAYADPTSGVAFTDAPLVDRPCGYVALAAGIKRRVRIPVIVVGRIEPAEADSLVAEGRADFVAMARPLLADPALASKLAAGRPESVRPCIYCYRCVGQIFLNESVVCAVNPATGREAESELTPAAHPRHVLVVGGGPAGMEAARIAALRGHRVTLCERHDRLGGTLLFSELVYPPNGRLVRHLAGQVRDAGVDVRVRTRVTLALAREIAPDVIIVATGARRETPEIPGAVRRNVLSGDDLRALLTGSDAQAASEKLSFAQRAVLGAGRLVGATGDMTLARELTRRWMPLGRRVAIVGGGLVGVELAEFLAERGRGVVVLEEGPTLAPEMALPRRWRALFEARERGVQFVTRARVTRIDEDGIVYDDASGASQRIRVDQVILATGTRGDASVADELRGLGAEIHRIGDCERVGYVEGALRSAAQVAGSL